MVGAATTLVIAIIEAIGNTKVSGTIAVSISTLLTFLISYLVPPSPDDQVVS